LDLQDVKEMNKLLEKFILHKYKNISFDIFDTLIERDVSDPLDIFALVEKETGEPNFRIKRIQAEKKARNKSISKEVNIDDIYREYEGDSCEYLKSVELRLEDEHIHVKKSMYNFYQQCISDGKNIFLVSDMYLKSDFIDELLKKKGINEYKKLYVSCEYKKNKVTSELFKTLLKDEDIVKNDIVHLGDSPKADLLGAGKAGIFSVLVMKKNMLGWIKGKLVRRRNRGCCR
jgi:predicted HAD superfamily hydrolase